MYFASTNEAQKIMGTCGPAWLDDFMPYVVRLEGTVDPTAAANFVGQWYLNTVTKQWFVSKSAGATIDWVAIGGETGFTNSSFSQVGGTDYVLNGSNSVANQGDVVRKAGSQSFRTYDDAIQFKVGGVTSAVNYFTVVGAITGVGPTFTATGTDTNIDTNFYAKGTGSTVFGNGAGAIFSVVDDGSGSSTANRFSIRAGASGVDPRLTSNRGAEYAVAASQAHTFIVNGLTMGSIRNYAAEGTSTMYPTLFGGTTQAGIIAEGSATNINISMGAKGNGIVNFTSSGGNIGRFDTNGQSTGLVNFPILRAATTGNPIEIRPGGGDTDIDILITGRNAGYVKFGTYAAGAVVQGGYITIKDAGGTLRKLMVGP